MTLAILVPSRGRPHNLKRFLEAVRDTVDDATALVRLDFDDSTLPDYLELCSELPAHFVLYGARVGLAASLNELANIAVNEEGFSHVGMFGDDVLPITPGWDTAMVQALNGKLGVAYGDDGLRDKHAPDLPTHYITQAEVYTRLGYLAPPGFQHLFLDNVAREIGRFLRNLVFVPVTLRHLHPWAEGEELHDATYAEGGRNKTIREADRQAYVEWVRQGLWKPVLA